MGLILWAPEFQPNLFYRSDENAWRRLKSMWGSHINELVVRSQAFSLWDAGDPRKARNYFTKFVGGDKNQTDGLMERLAQFYQEAGNIPNAVFVYRELIKANEKSFKSVHYQMQIVYAIETQNEVDATAAAIYATVELYHKAKNDDSFTDKTPDLVEQSHREIEAYTRETAKWYHRVSHGSSSLYGKLAFELYKIYFELLVVSPLQRAHERIWLCLRYAWD